MVIGIFILSATDKERIISSNTISTQDSSILEMSKDSYSINKKENTLNLIKVNTTKTQDTIPEEQLVTSLTISPTLFNKSINSSRIKYNLSCIIESDDEEIIEDTRKIASATICSGDNKVNFKNINYNEINKSTTLYSLYF